MKICEKGELRRDVIRMLAANNRVPAIMDGDLNAMIGACKVGEERIIRLVKKYGLDTVLEAIEYILGYSERRVRAEIARWPDGEYVGESTLDQDFNGTDDVNVKVTVKVKGDRCTVDLTGSHPQTKGFVNSVPGNTKSWVYTEFSVVMPDVPINSGFFRPIDVYIPEGTVVNPISPAPVGNSTICIGSDIGQATMKALEKIVPEKTGSAFLDLTIDTVYGHDSRHNGELYITFDYSATPTSSGGAQGTDGWGGFSAPHAAMKMPPYELMESEFPFIYYQCEYAIDAAAAGKWRGTPSNWMQRAATTDPVHNNIFIQAARHPLQGFAGGGEGAGNFCILDYNGPNQRLIQDVAFDYVQKPGEILFSQKQGGGGWGDPLERDPSLVLRDVLDEYISIEGARRDYGVVIDGATVAVDEVATEDLRSQLRSNRQTKC